MAVIFELRHYELNLLNPTVIEVMELTFNRVCEMAMNGIITLPICSNVITDSPIIDDVCEYLDIMGFTSMFDYDYISGVVSSSLSEFLMEHNEIEMKRNGKWFTILSNDPQRYMVI